MLVELLLDATRTSPNVVAVEDATRSITYRRLTALAAVMRDVVLHESRCERIGVMLPASTAFPAMLFGCLWAKRVPIPLNFLLAPEELTKVVKDAELDVIFTINHFRELVEKLPARAIMLEELPLKSRMMLSWLRKWPSVPAVQPNDTAVILYTSGTTAEPKGVELSHANLHSNVVDGMGSLNLTPPETFLNTLPPFHVFGLTGNVLAPVVVRSTVFAIPRFSPLAVVKACSEKKITIMLAIPSMYAAILKTKSTKREDFASVKLAISGGEPLADTVRDGFLERFGVQLREGYGLTETSPIISVSSATHYRNGTVGKLIPRVEARIVSADGAEVPQGGEGEIRVRGPNVMKGYYRKSEETRRAFDANGWFCTGDIGRFDADGYLKITGRVKDMLIIGGENVFPREIEAVLEECEGVLMAAVIGVPDELRGEAPVAFVVPKEGATVDEAALRNHAKQSLAGYKVPRRVIIRDDLPKGPTGKVLKRKLKELL